MKGIGGRYVLFVLMGAISTVVVAVATVFVMIFAQHRDQAALDQADAKSLMAIELCRRSLGADFFGSGGDAAPRPDRAREIEAKSDAIRRQLGLLSLSLALFANDRLVFATATAPLTRPEQALSFSTIKDDRGAVRRIVVAREESQGRASLFVADVQLWSRGVLARRGVLAATIVCLGGLGVGFLLALALAKALDARLGELTEALARIAAGDFDAPQGGRPFRWPPALSLAIDLARQSLKRRWTEARQGEAKLRGLIEVTDGWTWEVDPNGTYTYASPQVEAILGYKPEEVIGKPAFSLIARDEVENVEKTFRKAAAAKQPFAALENSCFHKDGHLVTLETHGVPFFDETGEIAGYRGVDRDVSERKKVEMALKDSEEWFHTLFENANDAIQLLDEEVFIDCNLKAVEMYGCVSKGEIIGHTPLDFSPAVQPDGRDSREKAMVYIQAAALGASQRFYWLHYRKDGSPIDTEVSLNRVCIKGKTYIQAIGRDITEQKKSEAALVASERNYREIFNAIGDPIVVHDMETGDILDVNLAMQEMFQYTREEALRLSVEAISQNQSPYTRQDAERWIRAAATEGPQRFEWLARRKNGELFWLEVDLKVVVIAGQPRVMAVDRDIAERKKAAEELENRERFLNSIIDQSPFAIWICDMNGVMRRVNPALLKLLGRNETRLIGAYNILKDPNVEKQGLTPFIRGVFEEGKTVHFTTKWDDENSPTREDGKSVYVEATMFPIFDANNKMTNAVLHLIDISDRVRAEEEKENLQSQLSQAQKMETVGRLAGGVAHDFNNMLSVIFGNVEIAIKRMNAGQPIVTNLQEIRKAAQRSADLTQQLLAFARKQTVEPKTLDLNETVTGMLKMLRRLLGENINLVWEPTPGLWSVRIDPSQVDQLLVNLCVNSRDAFSGVGKVVIETNNKTFDEDYCACHRGFLPGDYVSLVVSDNGCGMDKETLAHVFEPFFTTKGPGKGTGLGLATVYGIVKQNNGFINIYSEPAQGTMFAIYLPRHAAPEKRAREEMVAVEDIRGAETILLVEDERAILNLIKDILKDLGYRVIPAGTPGEAIRLAQERPGEIHLLLTDVVMPEMSGRDLSKNLLSLCPGLKCLFMSGYTANVIAHHGVLDEGVQFIQKPFSIRDLAIKIKSVLKKTEGSA